MGMSRVFCPGHIYIANKVTSDLVDAGGLGFRV